MTDADLCRARGWCVGDLLWGVECGRSAVIRLTAIGERLVLARAVERDGVDVDADEAHWSLSCREWVRVPR